MTALRQLPDELRNGAVWNLSAVAGNDLVADFAAAFGSCSFVESVNDLLRMGLP